MTYNESVGCERLTHSHGMSHECDPEERPGRAAREGSHVKVDQGRIVWEFLPMNQRASGKKKKPIRALLCKVVMSECHCTSGHL